MASDSFAPEAPLPASVVKVVDIHLRITDAEAGPPAVPKIYFGRYSFDQLDAEGKIVNVREGMLIQHLTATQINQIKAFLDAMLVKAQGSVG